MFRTPRTSTRLVPFATFTICTTCIIVIIFHRRIANQFDDMWRGTSSRFIVFLERSAVVNGDETRAVAPQFGP